MQIKIFNIPIPGGEKMEEEMNVFLRSKRVIQTESHVVSNGKSSFWCFCIKYLVSNNMETTKFARAKKKVDYKEVLDEVSFQRFAHMREIRRKLSKEEGIPAYAIFTDEELAGLAKIEILTTTAMKKVKGVGEKKVEKYASHFINSTNEKSESSN